MIDAVFLAARAENFAEWLEVALFWLVVLFAIVQTIRASYWQSKYDELRNCPAIREVARQLLEEPLTAAEEQKRRGQP